MACWISHRSFRLSIIFSHPMLSFSVSSLENGNTMNLLPKLGDWKWFWISLSFWAHISNQYPSSPVLPPFHHLLPTPPHPCLPHWKPLFPFLYPNGCNHLQMTFFPQPYHLPICSPHGFQDRLSKDADLIMTPSFLTQFDDPSQSSGWSSLMSMVWRPSCSHLPAATPGALCITCSVLAVPRVYYAHMHPHSLLFPLPGMVFPLPLISMVWQITFYPSKLSITIIFWVDASQLGLGPSWVFLSSPVDPSP